MNVYNKGVKQANQLREDVHYINLSFGVCIEALGEKKTLPAELDLKGHLESMQI